jgi:hypothetical protein
MLWPLDPEKRGRAFESARAANSRQLIANVAMLHEGDEPITFSERNALLSLLDQVAEAMPLRNIQEDAKQPFCRGIVAAHIFLEALRASKAGGDRYLQQVKSDVIKQLRGKPNFGRLSPSTVENLIWSVFRSVVHLWGAFCLGIVEGDLKFPCSLDKLPRFLATSEALRLAGELCPTRQRRTLLDPAKTLRVPQDVPLPRAGILWPRQSSGAV